MKRIPGLLAAAAVLWAVSPLGVAENAGESKDEAATPAAGEPSLRQPGFVFMELGTTRVEEYYSFFERVAGFKAMRREPGYIEARSERAELTFIDPKFWAGGHPFNGKLTGSGQGLGLEIGIVVADLDRAYAAALEFKDRGWPISTGIVRRPWGARDFRVLAPEGYYFRFTEGQ